MATDKTPGSVQVSVRPPPKMGGDEVEMAKFSQMREDMNGKVGSTYDHKAALYIGQSAIKDKGLPTSDPIERAKRPEPKKKKPLPRVERGWTTTQLLILGAVAVAVIRSFIK
jgi:hypothetical protein